MVKETIPMNYRIVILGGSMPKPKGYQSLPLPPDPAMEIFYTLQEDSPEGEWLRKRKAWFDNIINERLNGGEYD